MNNRFLKYSLVLFLSLSAFMTRAQNSFVADAPKVVAQNENFRLIFTSLGKSTNFEAPDLSQFEVLAGPSISTMDRSSTINGKRTESFEMIYTFILRAKEVGKFEIGEAKVKIEGKEHVSRKIQIEVVAADESTNSGQAEQQARQTGDIGEEDLFLRMTVNKRRVVEGEPIIATLKLYSRVDIAGFEDVKFPTFGGFWSQEIDPQREVRFERESYDNKIYNSAVLRQFMLIPQQTGTVLIDPAELVCAVQVRTRSSSAYRSIFEDFFDTGYQTIRKRITTPKINIEVSSLPAGAPSSFTGGVGDFKMEVKLVRDSLMAHEASSMIVTISGSGNLNLLDAPKISLPSDFELYDVKRSEKLTSGTGGTRGSKSYEYPFIPRSYGEFKLEPVEFTYYDINQKKYITLQSDRLTVNVARDQGGASSQNGPGITVGRQSVHSIGEDIRFISTNNKGLKQRDKFLTLSPLYLIIIACITILFSLLYFILSKRVKNREDIAGTKNRRARKIAKARLKNAQLLLKKSLYSAFYEELYKAITGYLSDKLILPVSDMNRDTLKERLVERGISDDIINRLEQLLEDCEFARYAPSEGYMAMEKHYQESVTIISSIEK